MDKHNVFNEEGFILIARSSTLTNQNEIIHFNVRDLLEDRVHVFVHLQFWQVA